MLREKARRDGIRNKSFREGIRIQPLFLEFEEVI
jgi:hypothetical protein